MTRVDVGGDGVAERRDPVERLHVVDGGAGMKLEADEKLRMLAHRKFRDVRPVRLDPFVPLELVDRFQVWEPSTSREVRRAVASRAGWTACERHHAVDAKQRSKPDRVAQVGVVLAGDRLVGMERVAPDVEGGDAQAARRDLCRPGLARGRVAKEQRCLAMRGRCVAACPDLEVGHARRRA